MVLPPLVMGGEHPRPVIKKIMLFLKNVKKYIHYLLLYIFHCHIPTRTPRPWLNNIKIKLAPAIKLKYPG